MFKNKTKQGFKRLSASLITASLLFQSANASGIPTVDVGNLQQSVMQYMQQMKDYTQQLKQYQEMAIQTINQNKQMIEQGIGMGIQEVLGEIDGMINETLQAVNEVIPLELIQETTDAIQSCQFLQDNAPSFKDMFSNLSSGKLRDAVANCAVGVNSEALAKDINEMMATIDDLKKTPDKLQEALDMQHTVNMVKMAKEKLETAVQSKDVNAIVKMYDEYHNGKSRFSKKKDLEDIKKLSQEIRTEKNQKQAQALTNTMLLKLLEQTQKQYEVTMQYYSLQANKIKSELDNEVKDYKADNNKEVINIKDTDAQKEFNSQFKPVTYNKAGLPDFDNIKAQFK